ncbi:MAG: hypothetical protein GY745_15650 [Actinomycetia bacterium]|nr:hypothetical protein [Actinomycetes bacterium]
MPTVVMGAGRDIVEHAGVPRFLFTDFPLGNPVGRPGDAPMQRQCVEMAFDLFEHAFAPRTTVQTPFVWSEDHEWRDQYMRVDESNQAELARLGAQRRDDQAAAKTDGRARSA